MLLCEITDMKKQRVFKFEVKLWMTAKETYKMLVTTLWNKTCGCLKTLQWRACVGGQKVLKDVTNSSCPLTPHSEKFIFFFVITED
jgi:hypothetical protein